MDFYKYNNWYNITYEISNDSKFKKLSKISLKIQDKYGVLIKAVVIDHQSSIIKAIKEALPRVSQQYCHFHFLKPWVGV